MHQAEAMTGSTAHSPTWGFLGFSSSVRQMPGDLRTAPRIISLSPLSLATDVTDASGLWLGTRTGAGGTNLKFFWPQPMAPWNTGQTFSICLSNGSTEKIMWSALRNRNLLLSLFFSSLCLYLSSFQHDLGYFQLRFLIIFLCLHIDSFPLGFFHIIYPFLSQIAHLMPLLV